jgi:hypothetical protein
MRWRTALAGGVVLAVLCATWVAHAVEYLRVHPEVGLTTAVTGPVHGYLLGAGACLTLLAALGGAALWRLWERMGRRIDALAGGARALFRGRRRGLARDALAASRVPRSRVAATPGASWAARWISLWLLLTLVQLLLYLAQENLEASRVHAPLPGLGAVLGVHWVAPLIHLDIAFLVASALVLVARRLSSRSARIDHLEALVRALLAAFDAPVSDPPPVSTAAHGSPRWLCGPLWRRPPPHPASA